MASLRPSPSWQLLHPQDWRRGKAGHGGDRDNGLADGTLLAVILWLGQIFKTVSWMLTQVLQQFPNFPGWEPSLLVAHIFLSIQAPYISPHLQAALLSSIQQNSEPALAPGSHLDMGNILSWPVTGGGRVFLNHRPLYLTSQQASLNQSHSVLFRFITYDPLSSSHCVGYISDIQAISVKLLWLGLGSGKRILCLSCCKVRE